MSDSVGTVTHWFGKLKELVVIIPAIHIFCCFLYLFFFYRSFGAGLVIFASPAEVFTVSITKVAPVYISIVLGGLFGYWSFETDQEIEDNNKPKAARVLKGVKRGQFWLIIIVSALAFLIGLTASVIGPYVHWYMMSFAFVLSSAFMLGKYGAELGLQSRTTLIFGFFAYSLLAIAINGLDDGQSLAKIRISHTDHEGAKCDEYIIVKDVADNFLAVDSAQNRVLVDQECELKFEIISGENVRLDRVPNPFLTIFEKVRDGLS